MGTGKRKAEKANESRRPKETRLKKPDKNPLGPKKPKTKTKKNKKNGNGTESHNKITKKLKKHETKAQTDVVQLPTASQQLGFFLHLYQSSSHIQLSSLELDSFKDTCMVELNQVPGKTNSTLVEHMKVAFGSSWKEVFCENIQKEGINPGSPTLLVISSSAIRSLELLRELRILTKECRAAKLFSKHMKIEEQVSQLKNRVNIASGTPSRIKKLIDMEALGLSRLAVIVLDMHTDVKGYSLLTLPQVKDEFWDLYKTYFHQQVLEGGLRICLYGGIPVISDTRKTDDEE